MEKEKGFTLVELSIVLVIIGLIVGGVVGGQSLQKSARTQKIIKELQTYKLAINAFELQFDSLPGDMPDAKDYWGNCGTYCNGDGNGRIERRYNGSQDLHEDTTAWQHLYLSGVLNESMSGKHQEASLQQTPAAVFAETLMYGFNEVWGVPSALACNGKYKNGVNIPLSSALDGATYFMVETGAGIFNSMSIRNSIIFGVNGGGSGFSVNSALSPPDAKKIDKKLDNGLAATGDVIAQNGKNGGACLSSGVYDLSKTGPECVMIFSLR